MANRGALAYQQITKMLLSGNVPGANSKNINPASLDLTISDEAYWVEGITLPAPHLPKTPQTIRELLPTMGARKHNCSGLYLVDEIYLVRLNEKVDLISQVYGYVNPKSSTGRNDVHVRILADHVPRYDALAPAGLSGEVWAAISPKSFPVIIPINSALSQARFFTGDTRFDELELELELSRLSKLGQSLIYDQNGDPVNYPDIKVSDHDGSIILTLDLSSEVVGYRAIQTKRPFDFGSALKSVSRAEFFEPVEKRSDGSMVLAKGGFYILLTAEYVSVPEHLSCEMVPMDERNGEFRSHYAGYIDPGWGWKPDNSVKGQPLVLEVRPFENLVVRDRAPFAKIRFERMVECPEVVYGGSNSTANYASQCRPRLSKHYQDE